MDIDLASLLVFRHLAVTGSFTDTGRRWKMSQPAVSVMISKLEASVGLVLLERSSSGARLTPAGMAFRDRVEEVCTAYLAFLDELRGLSRRLDRQVLVGFDRSWFCQQLRRELEKQAPTESAACVICDIAETWSEGLEAGRYDVVVAGRFLRAGLSAGLQEASIRRERGITVAWNPDFYPFPDSDFSFPDVLRTTLLLPSRRVVTGFSSFLLRWCEEAYGFQAANAVEFDAEEEAAAACRAGLGVLLAPGDAMPRLGEIGADLTHVRTFEFLLPSAFTFGVHCRLDEDSKEVLGVAAMVGKLARRLFG